MLHDIDFTIRPREIVTLVGPNGAGKTTLLACLLGLDTPDRGEVIRPPELRIGYVPQHFRRRPACRSPRASSCCSTPRTRAPGWIPPPRRCRSPACSTTRSSPSPAASCAACCCCARCCACRNSSSSTSRRRASTSPGRASFTGC
ncbi:MAG: ATP-binding cassette domain-containing protein [Alphaproteobacteria bacterium]